jgi:hypothetical protein
MKKIVTNTDLGQTTQSDNTNNASAAIKKFPSVQEAVFTSEWAWANNFVEQVRDELLGGDLESCLSAPQMCVLLEWSFRLGHRLGVEISGKDEIDTSQHNKIFHETFEQCREDLKEYGEP